MAWCLTGEDLSSGSASQKGGSAPSLCLAQTLHSVSNIVFLFALMWRFIHVIALHRFGFLDWSTAVLARTAGFGAILTILFTILVVVCEKEITGTGIFWVVTSCVTWTLAIANVKAEMWRTHRWPGRSTRLFIITSFIFTSVVAAAGVHASNRDDVETSSTTSVLTILLMLSTLYVVLIVFAQPLWRRLFFNPNSNNISLCSRICGEDELAYEERQKQRSLQQYSLEFSLHSPIATSYGPGGTPYGESQTSVFFSSIREALWPFDNSDDLDTVGLTSSSIYSSLVNPSSNIGMTDIEEIEFYTSGSSRPAASVQSSLVESAIDRNITPTNANGASINNSTGFSLFGSMRSLVGRSSAVLSRTHSSETIDVEESLEDGLPRDDSLESSSRASWSINDRSSSIASFNTGAESFMSSSMSVTSVSRALTSVMESHREKVRASHPIFQPAAPSGQGNSVVSKLLDGTRNATNDDNNIRRLYGRVYRVDIKNWNFREQEGTTPPLELDEDGNSSLASKSVREVEFEIIIHATVDSDLTTNSEANGEQPAIWSVWKTTSEIHSLHSSVVAALGDYAPTRPTFVTNTRGEEQVNTVSVQNDMRAASVFINTLLRSRAESKIRPLQEFLELWRVKPFELNIGADFESNMFDDILSPTNPTDLTPAVTTTSGITTPYGEQSLTHRPLNSNSPEEIELLQDKWRKMVVLMRIKLKPADVGVRCRLFEGVITGKAIVDWLVLREGETPAHDYQNVHNVRDACALCQELVACKLLRPVCQGFIGDSSSTDVEDNSSFSDRPTYLYQFEKKNNSAARCVIFGTTVTVAIPSFTQAMDDEAGVTLSSLTQGGEEEGGTGKNTHVRYIVEVSHGGDNWQVARRFREFEQLSKSLLKENIRPATSLPTKFKFQRSGQVDEARRTGLEAFLESALQAVIDDGTDKALEIMANFLDDDFDNLSIA